MTPDHEAREAAARALNPSAFEDHSSDRHYPLGASAWLDMREDARATANAAIDAYNANLREGMSDERLLSAFEEHFLAVVEDDRDFPALLNGLRAVAALSAQRQARFEPEWEYAVGYVNYDKRVLVEDEVTLDLEEAQEWVADALDSGVFSNAIVVRRPASVRSWEPVEGKSDE